MPLELSVGLWFGSAPLSSQHWGNLSFPRCSSHLELFLIVFIGTLRIQLGITESIPLWQRFLYEWIFHLPEVVSFRRGQLLNWVYFEGCGVCILVNFGDIDLFWADLSWRWCSLAELLVGPRARFCRSWLFSAEPAYLRGRFLSHWLRFGGVSLCSLR